MDRAAKRRDRILSQNLPRQAEAMNDTAATPPLEPRKRAALRPLSPRSPRDHHLAMSPVNRGNLFSFDDASSSSSPQQSIANLPDPSSAEDESIALARALMAEEAMESYAMAADNLRYNAAQYSQEDLEALQAALDDNEEEGDGESGEQYDMMLRLGEAMGDVKKDRWAMVSDEHMSALETFKFDPSTAVNLGPEDSRRKCLVCQFDYVEDDELRQLPCNHCFHKECVDQWLKNNDCCAYCRKPILNDDN